MMCYEKIFGMFGSFTIYYLHARLFS